MPAVDHLRVFLSRTVSRATTCRGMPFARKACFKIQYCSFSSRSSCLLNGVITIGNYVLTIRFFLYSFSYFFNFFVFEPRNRDTTDSIVSQGKAKHFIHSKNVRKVSPRKARNNS